MHDTDYKSFYDERRSQTYSHDYKNMSAENDPHYSMLKAFIEKYALEDKTCLEIGSSGGVLQDVVQNYYGTDIADSLAEYYHKPFRVAEGTRYPFDDEMFDVVWTFATFEHIPHLQEALLEITRLLKPGGILLFKPFWYCNSWAADGYEVRPYSDFDFKGRLIKASIPIRSSVLWRSFVIFPKRVYRHLKFMLGHKYEKILYKKIKPNYEVYWTSDSDACNHIDPHDAILWFESHGFECLSHPMNLRAFFVRTGSVVFRKKTKQV